MAAQNASPNWWNTSPSTHWGNFNNYYRKTKMYNNWGPKANEKVVNAGTSVLGGLDKAFKGRNWALPVGLGLAGAAASYAAIRHRHSAATAVFGAAMTSVAITGGTYAAMRYSSNLKKVLLTASTKMAGRVFHTYGPE